MGGHTKVNVHALAEYGKKLAGGGSDQSGLGRFRTGTTGPIVDISSPQLGLIDTNEAQVFRDWYHDHVSDALRQLIADSTTGLLALGNGAVVMAANYKGGDLSQAAALDKVFDLFNRSAATPSIAYDLAHNRKLADRTKVTNVDRLGHDPAGPSHLSRAERAMAQAHHHRTTYGKDEQWHPVQDGSTP